MIKRLSAILLIAVFYIAGGLAAGVRISESPARGKRSVQVGDMFYIYIEVSDIEAAPQAPNNVPGAKLMYFERTGQSSSFSSVNGKTTQSFSYTYTATLRALKEGNFTFGPITVGGVKSNQIKYTIGGADNNSSQTQSSSPNMKQTGSDDDSKPKYIGKGDGNLFLKAIVSNTTAFEQQALVYTVKLYTTYDAIKFIGATAAPKFDGFVIEESKDVSNSLSYESYQGKTYATAVIARYIIFPQMTGSLKVTGNTYTVSVDRREYYHDPFFGSMSYSTPLQLNVTPNDLVINVKPLPSPKPADFSGAVGTFKLSSELKSASFKAYQAGAIVYKVEGTGNIKYIQLPDLSALYPSEIEIYTPKTSQNVKVGSSNVSGSVSFDYSFMPLEEGDFKIPEVKLVYFDPQSATYKTSIAKGYNIKVGKGSAADEKAHDNRVKFNQDFVKFDAKKLSKHYEPLVYSLLYFLWYLIPVVLIMVAYAIRSRYVSQHSDLAAFNSKRADKLARKRLKKAAAALKKNDNDLFYTELLTALWGYVSDKLKMPTSELFRDNIRQVMSDKGISDEIITSFITEIDNAEFAKYSSSASGINMRSAYDSAVKLINTIEKSI